MKIVGALPDDDIRRTIRHISRQSDRDFLIIRVTSDVELIRCRCGIIGNRRNRIARSNGCQNLPITADLAVDLAAWT